MNAMANNRRMRGLDDSLSNKLGDAVTGALTESESKQHEILTRSQQKLRDAEDQVIVAGREKAEIDDRIRRTKAQIVQLQDLMLLDEQNSADLTSSVKADLQLIHSLRQDGITLPA